MTLSETVLNLNVVEFEHRPKLNWQLEKVLLTSHPSVILQGPCSLFNIKIQWLIFDWSQHRTHNGRLAVWSSSESGH